MTRYAVRKIKRKLQSFFKKLGNLKLAERNLKNVNHLDVTMNPMTKYITHSEFNRLHSAIIYLPTSIGNRLSNISSNDYFL